MHFSKVFMGAAGLTEDALYNANVLMVEAEEQMMTAADQVIVLADHSKFGKRSLARLCGWEQIDTVVSDADLSERWQAAVKAAGAELILAPAREAAELRK